MSFFSPILAMLSSEHGLARTGIETGTGAAAEQISPSLWRLEQVPPHFPIHSQRTVHLLTVAVACLGAMKNSRARRTQ